jgi:hypothetical protein
MSAEKSVCAYVMLPANRTAKMQETRMLFDMAKKYMPFLTAESCQLFFSGIIHGRLFPVGVPQ